MVGVIAPDVYDVILNHKEIQEILPHRYPFLLVDKVIAMDLEEESIVAVKNVTFNEAFFQGHFPGAPIMPGVLIIEALAQAGGILVNQKGFTDKIAVLLNVNKAKFRIPVKPGDVLHLYAQAIHYTSKGGRMETKALVNGKAAVTAEMAFAMVDKEQI